MISYPPDEEHKDDVADKLSSHDSSNATPGRKADSPVLIFELADEYTDDSADSAAAYPSLY